jgi:hypothetical protein
MRNYGGGLRGYLQCDVPVDQVRIFKKSKAIKMAGFSGSN